MLLALSTLFALFAFELHWPKAPPLSVHETTLLRVSLALFESCTITSGSGSAKLLTACTMAHAVRAFLHGDPAGRAVQPAPPIAPPEKHTPMLFVYVLMVWLVCSETVFEPVPDGAVAKFV